MIKFLLWLFGIGCPCWWGDYESCDPERACSHKRPEPITQRPNIRKAGK